MKVLLTGAAGQLGRALARTRPATVELIAVSRAQLDVTDARAVESMVAASRPDVVLNAAAYTQVDAAQGAPQDAERGNVLGPAALAGACRACGARLVHLSTDYVFDGEANVPYLPESPTRPRSVYGDTKRRGEEQVQALLGGQALIVRTAWLYAHEGRNFLTRMLQLMAERPQLSVVIDQVGAPTAADDLATALWRMIASRGAGLHHWCNSGVASWYDFAVAIGEEAHARGLLARVPPITPILSIDYPTPAARPHYSVLDKRSAEALTGELAAHWRDALRRVVGKIGAGAGQ